MFFLIDMSSKVNSAKKIVEQLIDTVLACVVKTSKIKFNKNKKLRKKNKKQSKNSKYVSRPSVISCGSQGEVPAKPSSVVFYDRKLWKVRKDSEGVLNLEKYES